MFVAGLVMRHSQKEFVAPNGRSQILRSKKPSRPLADEGVRSPQGDSSRDRDRQRGALTSELSCALVSGLIMPIMTFVGNLDYVVIAVLGSLRIAAGIMSQG
jgi:ATP-binding cassette, subfamily B, multidrug efflux pump